MLTSDSSVTNWDLAGLKAQPSVSAQRISPVIGCFIQAHLL